MSVIYVVDTSEWINLYRLYPKEIFPSLWENIGRLISEERISSPKEVLEEVKYGQDGLTEWFKTQQNIFHDTNDLIGKVRRIIEEHRELVNPNAPRESADPYLIALAMWHRDNTVGLPPTIVTAENPHRESSIPYVARAYGIQTCNRVEMFQKEGWTF